MPSTVVDYCGDFFSIFIEMRSKLIANAGCILSLILVLKSQPTIGKLEDKETNKEVLNKQVEQDYVVSERSIKRIE